MTRPPRRLAEGLLLLGLALLAVAAILWIVPSNEYVFLPDVAHPVEPLVTVPKQLEQADRDSGGIYFVDVIVRKASLLEKIYPGIHEGAQLEPASAVVPPGANDQQRVKLDLQEMSRSQSVAAVVALRALGKKVVANPTGALIDAVDPKLSANGKLHPGERIVAVDGHDVGSLADLRRLVEAHKPGTTLQVTVREHGGASRTVPVQTATRQGRTVIGVVVEQSLDVKLPFPIKINAGSIGGPSAGVAFALDIMEQLGKDVDRGHKVAATGELALDGSVLPVGGLEQKTIGARRAGVDVFLVPAGDNAATARRYAHGLRVVPVKSFRQALSVLATLPRIDKKK